MKCKLRKWKLSDAVDLASALSNKNILNNLRDGLPYPYTALGFVPTDEEQEISRKVIIKGESEMNVTYEHKPAMTFIGFSTSIRPKDGYVKCPEFWDKEYSQKYAKLWHTMKPETPIEKAILENQIGMFAICDEKEGSFEYWIAGLYMGGDVPEGLNLFTFPESDWAVFSAKGALPKSLQDLNTQVWQKWYPNEGQKYKGNGNAMLEVYSAGNMQSPDYECGIWVPIYRSQEDNEQETAEIVSAMTITGIL